MTEGRGQAEASTHHAEYKIPEGKLVVVDLRVEQGRLRHVRLSGDFFLEPPEVLDTINDTLNGMSRDSTPEQLEHAVRASIGSDVMMYGLTAPGIAVVIRRALA